MGLKKTPMVDLTKKADLSLRKHGIVADGKGGLKVRLVLDHSVSMQPWYRSGAVQKLTEQVLALASKLDDDGTIEVWFFGSDVSDVYTLSLTPGTPEYYEGWVDRMHLREPWGSTNYVAAINETAAYRRQQGETDPALVIFQTDGSPDSRPATVSALQAVAGEDVFYAFVGFGTKRQVAFLTELDNIPGRVRDNASALIVPDFITITDEAVYDGVLGEFVGQWLPQVLA